MICGGPPAASILFNLPSAKKPMKRPSGDQKGEDEFSVPGSVRTERESSGRRARRLRPEESRATKAMVVPSGETATARSAESSDKTIEDRIGPVVFASRRGKRSTDARPTARTAAIAQAAPSPKRM